MKFSAIEYQFEPSLYVDYLFVQKTEYIYCKELGSIYCFLCFFLFLNFGLTSSQDLVIMSSQN